MFQVVELVADDVYVVGRRRGGVDRVVAAGLALETASIAMYALAPLRSRIAAGP